MKRWTALIGTMLGCMVAAACGSADEYVEDGEDLGEVQQAVSFLSCPTIPGYTRFVSTYNNCGGHEVSCTFANDRLQQKTVSTPYPVGTTTCCPAGGCPNQFCYTITGYSAYKCE